MVTQACIFFYNAVWDLRLSKMLISASGVCQMKNEELRSHAVGCKIKSNLKIISKKFGKIILSILRCRQILPFSVTNFELRKIRCDKLIHIF